MNDDIENDEIANAKHKQINCHLFTTNLVKMNLYGFMTMGAKTKLNKNEHMRSAMRQLIVCVNRRLQAHAYIPSYTIVELYVQYTV